LLPLLYNIPSSDRDWNVWSLSHAASHMKIIQAVLAQKGRRLSQYQLDPIALDDFDDFLNRNQQAHNDIAGILGISNVDLQEVDVNDEGQKRAWIQLHADAHRDFEMALRI
jgi:hypothetical protein